MTTATPTPQEVGGSTASPQPPNRRRTAYRIWLITVGFLLVIAAIFGLALMNAASRDTNGAAPSAGTTQVVQPPAATTDSGQNGSLPDTLEGQVALFNELDGVKEWYATYPGERAVASWDNQRIARWFNRVLQIACENDPVNWRIYLNGIADWHTPFYGNHFSLPDRCGQTFALPSPISNMARNRTINLIANDNIGVTVPYTIKFVEDGGQRVEAGTQQPTGNWMITGIQQ